MMQLSYLGLSLGVAVCAAYSSGGPALGALSLLLALAALRWLAPEEPVRSGGGGGKSSKTEVATRTSLLQANANRFQQLTSPADANRESLQGVFPGSGRGLVDFGLPEPHTVENENCSCTTHVLFNPPDKTGPFAEHFAGKKRLWEIRFQLRVKRAPKKPLVFGIELAEYVPVSGWAKRIQQMTVAMLRKVVGNDLYHSAGEDPNTVQGEAERPVFAMPLWAFDQLIISEPGQEPDITSVEGLGMLRTEGRVNFIRTMNSLQLQTDKVYTFSFWCISRFVDVLNWNLLGVVPGGIDFNVFCGRPPVHIVIYSLEDSKEDDRETRHLQSRKKYFSNMALWSTKVPPTRPQLRAMLQDGEVAAVEEDTDVQSRWCCWR